MTARRRFTVSAPDWGHTHLSSDAVVAFVDDELAHGPHARAVAHVAACRECAAEVVSQRQARTALRGAACPSLPTSLLSSLRSIPQDTELPGPPAGLAVTTDGQLVSVLHAEPCGSAEQAHGRRPSSRRIRFGAGAAMSGLAVGAIALGSAALPGEQARTPPPERGLFGGSVVGPVPVAPARLGLDSGNRQSVADDDPDGRFADRMSRTPRTFLRPGPR